MSSAKLPPPVGHQDLANSPTWGDDDGLEPATSGPACPTCGGPAGGAPYCPVDGSLMEGPFSIGERYEVRELVGAGGMAFVFGAQHKLLGKSVAVKILRPERAVDPRQTNRFLREARAAAQLEHENIVSILDSGRDDKLGVSFLVMERLAGLSLADLIRKEGRLPWRRAVALLQQICRAADAAHSTGIVHRDLAPKNILLVESSGRSDIVKLLDFGLSRMATGADRITTTGTVLGTPAYAAPEQLSGDSDLDQRADIYAIGVIAYELLCGRLPLEAPSAAAMIASKLTSEPRRLRERFPEVELPAALDNIIMKCLARAPGSRYESAMALGKALDALGPAAVASRPGADQLPGATIGAYKVTTCIGTGGLGAVYRGEHSIIGTKAAIKVLRAEVAANEDFVTRFVNEARASSEIGSPHIPRYFDFGYLEDGRPYAVMELLEGETLAARLERTGPMSFAATASLLRQCTTALASAHAVGIVHRDIKPENLFFATDTDGVETVKLLDFGIAKDLSLEGPAAMTQIGYFLGTPHYCAPEQVHGTGVGPSADIYALGATAFEMLTGRPPFVGDVNEILGAKLAKVAPPLRELRIDTPQAVNDTVASMLARDVPQRPSSMQQVCELVASWDTSGNATPSASVGVGTLPGAVPPTPTPAPAAYTATPITNTGAVISAPLAPANRRPLQLGAVAVAVVALVVAALVVRGGGEPDSVPAPTEPQVTSPTPAAEPVAPTPGVVTKPIAQPAAAVDSSDADVPDTDTSGDDDLIATPEPAAATPVTATPQRKRARQRRDRQAASSKDRTKPSPAAKQPPTKAPAHDASTSGDGVIIADPYAE